MTIAFIVAAIIVIGAIAFFFYRKGSPSGSKSSDWRITYSPGMPDTMSKTAEGWHYFDFPLVDGIHYVLKYQNPKNPTLLTMTFRVESNEEAVYAESNPHGVAAQVRPMIEVRGDNMRDDYGRWWAHSDSYVLGSNDNQDITISVPITVDKWSSVFGHSDPQAFKDSMDNIGQAGVTFGGQFYGHGVKLLTGKARFILKDFQLT